jgi:hypothetical protein
MQQLVDEVRQAGIEPGEERALRRQLRQLDGRRAAAQACRLISVGLGGDGGGGMADAMRDVQLQVKQLLSQEERLAAQAAAELAAEGAEQPSSGHAAAAAAAGEEVGADEDSAQAMLLSSLALLDQAQLLLDEAGEKVSGEQEESAGGPLQPPTCRACKACRVRLQVQLSLEPCLSHVCLSVCAYTRAGDAVRAAVPLFATRI